MSKTAYQSPFDSKAQPWHKPVLQSKTASMLLVGILLLGTVSTGSAQDLQLVPQPYDDIQGVFSNGGGGPFLTQLAIPFPGRVWVSGTVQDNGFGTPTGGYFTLGGKMRLGEDYLGGRWLVEGRGHVSYETGNIFGNLGLERVMTIDPINSDLGGVVWLDSDQTPSDRFGHSFKQIGLSGYMRNEFYKFQVNGYFPVDDTGFVLGAAGGGKAFVGNNILLQSGLDTAMRGFDASLQFRPIAMSMFQGTIDLGGYYFTDPDDAVTGVRGFGGVRIGAGIQTMNGLMLQAEVNHDDQFDTTGFFRVVLNSAVFGDYDARGRDLDPTYRNDHITVVHQDPVFALDPQNGNARYRVVHVDSTNTDPSGGDGTFENPFTTLARADGVVNPGNSLANDIIFVREGVGNYTDPIALLPDQFLFGDGVAHLIPTQLGNQLFCSDIDGNIPTIGGITLGGDNIIRGFNISPTAGNTGILANGLAAGVNNAGVPTGLVRNTGTLVDQVQIATGVDGINITNSNGAFRFIDSDTSNGVGMSISNTTGIAFQVNGGGATLDVDYLGDITNTVASGRMIQITNPVLGSNIAFTNGTQLTDVTGGGIFVSGAAGTVIITTPQTLTGSTGPGIDIRDSAATGVVTIANSTITNSSIAGVNLNNNAAGSAITFTNLAINEATGAIGLFSNNTAMLTINGNNSIVNTGNAAIVMNGFAAGGVDSTINATFANVSSINSAAEGINLNRIAGALTIAQTTIDESTLDSILIRNNGPVGGALVSNFNLVNITNSGVLLGAFGNGVRIDQTAANTYNFNTLNIETDNGNGLHASTAGTLNVLGGTITANGGAAIIINPTQFDLTFSGISSFDSISDGVSIGGVIGNSRLTVGQTIVGNATGAGIRVFNVATAGTTFAGDFGTTTIDGGSGIILNDNNDADLGTSNLTFNNLEVTANNGDGLLIDDDNNVGGVTNFTLNLNGNAPRVQATTGSALNITGANAMTNSAAGWAFQDVISVSSTSNGVLLDDLNQNFSVTGLLDIANSAGDGFVARNMPVDVTLNSIDLDGTGGDSIDVSGYTGSFTVNGGTIDTASANSINVENGASNANFVFSNIAITFGTNNNQTGINVRSGDGSVLISNNSIDVNNTTNATGIFVEGNNSANGFNLGMNVSTNNTSANLGAGSIGFNFNNGVNIIGNIEVDGLNFNP